MISAAIAEKGVHRVRNGQGSSVAFPNAHKLELSHAAQPPEAHADGLTGFDLTSTLQTEI